MAISPEDWIQFAIELVSFGVASASVYMVYRLEKAYPELTKSGWKEVFIAVIMLSLHFLIDAVDTLVHATEEKVTLDLFGVAYEIRPTYTVLNLTEKTLAVVGLLFLLIGMIKIAGYLYEMWKGE